MTRSPSPYRNTLRREYDSRAVLQVGLFFCEQKLHQLNGHRDTPAGHHGSVGGS